MLDKARSIYETLKSSWKAGANGDDIQLALYAIAEDEFDSGNVKKGLLAKIRAESNYDEKLTKGNYVRARVDVLMIHRNEIVSLMNQIENVDRLISSLKNDILSLDKEVVIENHPTVNDYIVAEREVDEEISIKLKFYNEVKIFCKALLIVSFVLLVLFKIQNSPDGEKGLLYFSLIAFLISALSFVQYKISSKKFRLMLLTSEYTMKREKDISEKAAKLVEVRNKKRRMNRDSDKKRLEDREAEIVILKNRLQMIIS